MKGWCCWCGSLIWTPSQRTRCGHARGQLGSSSSGLPGIWWCLAAAARRGSWGWLGVGSHTRLGPRAHPFIHVLCPSPAAPPTPGAPTPPQIQVSQPPPSLSNLLLLFLLLLLLLTQIFGQGQMEEAGTMLSTLYIFNSFHHHRDARGRHYNYHLYF